MKLNLSFHCLLKLALGCGLLMVSAVAHGGKTDDLAAEQMSVRELMRLDTALALNQSREKLRTRYKSGTTVDDIGAVAQSGSVNLLAIYGVGKKLLAEVRVGAQSYVYMHGRLLPVGIKASSTALLLRGMTATCIQLERDEQSHTLCLHPSVRVGE